MTASSGNRHGPTIRSSGLMPRTARPLSFPVIQMKRQTVLTVAGIVAMCAVAFVMCAVGIVLVNPDVVTEGLMHKGRNADIRTMEAVFKRGDFDTVPNGRMHTYDDGSWVFVMATDSHHGGGNSRCSGIIRGSTLLSWPRLRSRRGSRDQPREVPFQPRPSWHKVHKGEVKKYNQPLHTTADSCR